MDSQASTPAKKIKTPKSANKSTKAPAENQDLKFAVTIMAQLIKSGQFQTPSWAKVAEQINGEADEGVPAVNTAAISKRWSRFRQRYGLDKVEVEPKAGEGTPATEKKRKGSKQGAPAKGQKQAKVGSVLGFDNEMSFEEAITRDVGSDGVRHSTGEEGEGEEGEGEEGEGEM